MGRYSRFSGYLLDILGLTPPVISMSGRESPAVLASEARVLERQGFLLS